MMADIAKVEWRTVAFHVIKCGVKVAVKERTQNGDVADPNPDEETALPST
jgi:hypothetical protein